ncbi:hypothetical protein FZEAL_5667, partial [Fusarium zealandicum]
MHTKSIVVAAALALASSTVVEANRPRIYFPRQVRREFNSDTAITAPEDLQDAAPAQDINKRDALSDFFSNMFGGERTEASEAKNKAKAVNIDPTRPINLGLKAPKKGGPSAVPPPALILQPTSSSTVEDPETPTEDPEPTTDADTETDTGILLAPTGIVTTSKPVARPVESKTSESKEDTTTRKPAPVETESTAPAPTTKEGLLGPVGGIVSSLLEPVNSKTEETKPAPVETNKSEPTKSDPKSESQSKPIETKTEEPVPTTKKGLLDPVESIISSILPVPIESETKESKPKPTETKTEEPVPTTKKGLL